MPNTLIHGPNELHQEFSGYTIAQIELAVAESMNIEPGVVSVFVDGVHVQDRSNFVVQVGQRVEWVPDGGEKGIGEVATKELFCRSFRVTEAEWENCLEAGLVAAPLKHTTVLFVDDGAEYLERVRSKREGAPRLDRLNETELAIVELLRDGLHRTGAEIEDLLLQRESTSEFRKTLSRLRKLGVIRNSRKTGYSLCEQVFDCSHKT